MQTPYGALPYQNQHQKTVNHSEHSFVHCYWQHTNIQDLQDKTSVLPISNSMLLILNKGLKHKHFIHYLNARLDPRSN